MRIIDWSSDVCSSDLVSQHLADDLPRRLVDKPQIRIELRGRVGDEDLWTVQDVHVGGDCDIAKMKLRPDSSKTRARSHERHRLAFQKRLAIGQIGSAHVRTPVTNAHLVCRLLLEQK